MPLPRLLVCVCLLLASCSGVVASNEPAGQPQRESKSEAQEPSSHPETTSWVPEPGSWLPRAPARLAERLARTTRALDAAIDRWRASGGTDRWPPPREVVLLALDQQRIYQLLVGRADRRGATIGALPSGLRRAALDIAEAGASTRAGLGRVTFDGPIRMRTRAPLPPDELRGIYRDASRRFGVPWTLLAAVNFVETRFGRVISPSWVGAQGPMQFIPSTWAAYGMGGDIRDTRDAISGAANYLRANGAPGQMYRAVWAYNPVHW